LFLFAVLFFPLISDQVKVLSSLDYENIFRSAAAPLQWVENFLIANELTDETPGFLIREIWVGIQSVSQSVDFQSILNNLIELASGVFIGLLAITFITFMLLYEQGLLKRSFISLIPNRYFELIVNVVTKIERLLSNYLIGLLFQMTAIFTLASVGLSILGIKYALTIAFFAAVANLIPYAGPILGAVFGLIVALSTGNIDFGSNQYIIVTIQIITVFAIVQLVDNLFLQPLIFSKSVKAHPLEIFVIIFAGATIGGILGMILAIPAYTIIRVFALELYQGYRSYYIFRS
jgi:predicted PurR-regulated permease PerM